MRFLARERAVLEQFLPGLDDALADVPLADLEGSAALGIPLLRDAGGAGLVIPVEYKGKGANALDAVRVQRALGSRSPSLAVASTMHHFSVSSLVLLAETGGKEWLVLEAISAKNMLVASGFAEGRPDGHRPGPAQHRPRERPGGGPRHQSGRREAQVDTPRRRRRSRGFRRRR